jgi:hypothetical protein
MVKGISIHLVAISLVSFLISWADVAKGAPIPFDVLNGSLTFTTNPQTNKITDLNGFFGVAGRQLRIDSFELSPSSSRAPTGLVDFGTGQISFGVDYKLEYSLLDAVNGAAVGRDSVSGLFFESGIFDATSGQGVLDGSSEPGRANLDTTAQVINIALPGWLKELASGRTLIGMSPVPFQSGEVTSLTYLGDVAGGHEINLLVSANFGGSVIEATSSGSLTIQVVPEPTNSLLFATGLFGISIAVIIMTRRKRHLAEKLT